MKKILCLVCAALFVLFAASLSACKKEESKRTTYDIECAFSDNKLVGKEKVKFFNNTENSFSVLKFNLFANAYRRDARYKPIADAYAYKAYPNGESFGEIDIKKVTSGDDNIEFEICGEDKNILAIPLSEEVFPEECAEVTIEYEITLANVVARTGYNANTVNLANFYPILCAIDENGFFECVYYSCGDPYFSDCADYKVTFSAPTEFTVAASGKAISEKAENGVTEYTYELSSARSFCIVLSTKYESISCETDGVTVNYYYYDDETPAISMEYAVNSLKLFSSLFGKYPYGTFSVTQTEFIQGGMEFPCLVMISDELTDNSYREVIVHETAHQWWQTTVGNNEINYGFLDEGLAEYSTVLFYENYPEYGLSREDMIKSSEQTYKTYCTVYDKLFGGADTTMTRSLGEFTSEYEYVNIAYVKSCIMYDTLRKTIGEEKFFGGLKKYYADYSFLNAKPCDLVGSFVKCGADAEGFFDGFFDGKVII